MIEHIHGRGKQDTLIGLASTQADDFRKERLADARIADDDDVGTFLKELQIHQAEDAVFHLRPAFVVVELEAVDGTSNAETRETKAALNGTSVAHFQFAIGECLQRGRKTEIFGSSISQNLIQILAHRRQVELIQFLV